jgi:hypothetical protein
VAQGGGCELKPQYCLTTWKAEIRRISVQGQPRQIACKTISKITRAGGEMTQTLYARMNKREKKTRAK